MSRWTYVLEGVFFLFLASMCIYAAIALEAPKMLIPMFICLAVAGFYFYKGLAGRKKDSVVITDLSKRISEVGAGPDGGDSQGEGPATPEADEKETD